MTVTLNWDHSAQELWITLDGEVLPAEIAEHGPEILSHLDRATTKVDMIHSITKLESLKIQWTTLKTLMRRLRHPNISGAQFTCGPGRVRFWNGWQDLQGPGLEPSILILDSFEKNPKKWT